MPTRCLCLLLLLPFAACRPRPHAVVRGFYYWKTNFRLTGFERSRLQEAGCRELYLRCFDVATDRAGNIRPLGLLRKVPDSLPGMRITPVVYLTQDALNATQGAELRGLAGNIARLLGGLWQGRPGPEEIQIDCDWTATNRDRYFGLLRTLRREPFFRNKRLTCTIRLHQVKFQSRSGIPPVDRGLLMCYNMGSLKKAGNHNSILSPDLAAGYLQHLHDYPLPLDVALPLFDWCLQFRDGQFRGILRDLGPEELLASGRFRQSGTNLYTCLTTGELAGYDLRRGDQVRVERSQQPDIRKMATLAAKRLRNDSLRVLLFHCDSLILAKHPHEELEAIYGSFD